MAQPFTFFDVHRGSHVRVAPTEPLPRAGEVWVRGRYIPPTYPSALNVRVGEAGIKVWMVIQWLGFYNDDIERMLAEYGSVLTRDDTEAAIRFYRSNEVDGAEIDRKIAEEAA